MPTPDPAKLALKAIQNLGAYVYPWYTWIITGEVIGFAAFLNLLSIYWAWRRRHALRRPTSAEITNGEQGYSSSPRKGKESLRRLPHAVISAARIALFRWRIPVISGTLLEVILTALYIMMLLSFLFCNTAHLNVKVWATRAGALCTAQFPLIVALSMKNNVIQFLTGISHEKLNMMHRTTSRAALLMTWIHLWGLYVNHTALFSKTWRIVGLLAGVAQTLLTFISIKPIRKRFYEAFFISHILLVFIFLVGAYIHTYGANPRFSRYVWPCFLIWGLDRVSRYMRYLILSNFHAPNKSPATLELIAPDVVRITVRRRFPSVFPFFGGWKAGQHMFLAFPTIGPIESHPFTMTNLSQDSIATQQEGQSSEREMMFVLRARGGLTRRLQEHILMKNKAKVELGVNDTSLSCQVPIFMDGPYGSPTDISPYDTCVFVAGGTGITYTVSRMRELLSQAARDSACVRRIVFIWAIRDVSHLKWIAADLSKAVSSVPPNVELSISIYVTGLSGVPELSRSASELSTTGAPSPDIKEPTSPDKIYSEKHSVSEELPQGVDLYCGRPNLYEILENAITTATGPASVDVSGPESLVSAVRLALAAPFAGPRSVLRGEAPIVQLNVESFTM